MKRIPLLTLLTAGILIVLQQAYAQTAKTKPATAVAATEKKYVKLPEIATTLGRSDLNGGGISKRVFDSLLQQGVKLSGAGTIAGFNFTYAERVLYEDSAGNPLLQTDYLQEHCLGDSLTQGIRYSIFDRTKPGDTAYFDMIKVILPAGGEARGKPMKFLITR